MKKINFALVSDVVFYAVSVWFLSAALLRGTRAETWVCFVCATLTGLAAGILTFVLLYRRRSKRLLGKREREQRDALMLHLALETPERVRAALLTALRADGKDAHCEGDALCADGRKMIPQFTMQPLSADAVAGLLRRHGTQPFTLLCNSLSPEAAQLLDAFGRNAMAGDEVYALFLRTQTMPEPFICGEIPRRTLQKKIKLAFSKRNARPFFVSGMMLLIMSLFVFFPVYYLITGSVLLITAVLVRAFGYA